RHAYKATPRARGGRWAAARGLSPDARHDLWLGTLTFRRAYATESPLPSRGQAGGWRRRNGEQLPMSRARWAVFVVAALVAVAATAAITLARSPASPGAGGAGGGARAAATAGRGAASPQATATHGHAIGGPLLASHGLLVRYPATGARKL